VFLLTVKDALISLLLLLSIGLAAGQWTEELMTDFEGEELGPGFDLAYGEGEMPGTVMRSIVLGPDSSGPTGPSAPSGLAEAYYSMEQPAFGEIQQYSLSGREPSTVYFGGEATSYSAFRTGYFGTNALWIMGTWSWTQYAYCPLGAWMQLLAYSSTGGSAEFYEIYPSGRVDKKTYRLWPGYTRIAFHGDEPGRHILLFVVNNQPSNPVIIDVGTGAWPPGPVPGPIPPYSRVTVRSSWLTGFTVNVDGVQEYRDISDGRLDGVVSFTVPGDQYHSIRITSPGYLRSYYRFFRSGYSYTLTV
jgi:hypothetical protein